MARIAPEPPAALASSSSGAAFPFPLFEAEDDAILSRGPTPDRQYLPLMWLHKGTEDLAKHGGFTSPLPTSADGVTTAFLNQVLWGQCILPKTVSVVKFSAEKIGETKGFTSTCSRLTLDFGGLDPGPDCPTSVVIKFMGGDVQRVKGIEKWILHNIIFPNEIIFYATSPLFKNSSCDARYPNCYFSMTQGTNHFVMVEDLTALPYDCGDGMKAATRDQCLAIARWLAKLHGHHWERRSPDSNVPLGCQNLFAGADLELYPALLKKVYPKAFEAAFEAYPSEMGQLGRPFVALILSKIKAIARRLKRVEHRTLCHGDVKLDNLFFERVPEGKNPARANIIGVDWGMAGWGNAMGDFAYLFARSVEPEDRRLWMDDMLKVYRKELMRQAPRLDEPKPGANAQQVSGGRQYTEKMMMEDLKFSPIVPLFLIVGALKSQYAAIKAKTGMWAPESHRNETENIKRRWYDTSMKRLVALVKDFDLEGTLRDPKLERDPDLPVIPFCCFYRSPNQPKWNPA